MYACSICRMAAFLDRPTLPIHLFAPPRRKIGSIFAFLITKNKYERFRLSRHGGECMAVCGCVVRMPCRRELPMQLDFRPKPKPKSSHCDDGAARRKGEFNRLDQRAVVAHHCVAVKHDHMMCVVVADPAAVVKGLRRACRVPCCGGVLITTVRASKDTPP